MVRAIEVVRAQAAKGSAPRYDGRVARRWRWITSEMGRFLFVRVERWWSHSTSKPASKGSCHGNLVFASNTEFGAELIRLMGAAKLGVRSGGADVKGAVHRACGSGRDETDGAATEGLLLLLLLLPLTLCVGQYFCLILLRLYGLARTEMAMSSSRNR